MPAHCNQPLRKKLLRDVKAKIGRNGATMLKFIADLLADKDIGQILCGAFANWDGS